MPSRIFFGSSTGLSISLSPVVVDAIVPGFTVTRKIELSPVVAQAHVAGVIVGALNISIGPVQVHTVLPGLAVTVKRPLSPLIVHTTFPALGVAVASVPASAAVRFGYIQDRPTVAYDGSNLINRIIPFGTNSDDTPLSLERAAPENRPYTIKSAGSTYYIEDAVSITKHGLHEKRVYWSEIKVPATHTNTATQQGSQPFNQSQELLTIGAICTAGDTLSFVAAGVTYTYTFVAGTPSPGANQIAVGASVLEQQNNIRAAFGGSDGYNVGNGIVACSYFVGNVATLSDLTGGAAGTITISASFTSASNYLGGGIAGTSYPQTSAPASAPTSLGGTDYGELTANVVYWRAVNELIANRAEILAFACTVANGADIWALPGDRMHMRFEGWVETDEADFINGAPRVVYLSIDEPMVVVERHDRSTPSGVRDVSFVLACPQIQWPIPAVPTWPDTDPSGDSPVALPIPDNSGSFPPTFSDSPPFPDVADPGAAGLGDDIHKILTGDGVPFAPCCPDASTDITSGIINPAQDAAVGIAMVRNGVTGNVFDSTYEGISVSREVVRNGTLDTGSVETVAKLSGATPYGIVTVLSTDTGSLPTITDAKSLTWETLYDDNSVFGIRVTVFGAQIPTDFDYSAITIGNVPLSYNLCRFEVVYGVDSAVQIATASAATAATVTATLAAAIAKGTNVSYSILVRANEAYSGDRHAASAVGMAPAGGVSGYQASFQTGPTDTMETDTAYGLNVPSVTWELIGAAETADMFAIIIELNAA